MDCRENSSKFQFQQHMQMQPFGFVEQEQYNSSPHFSSYPSNSFNLYTTNQHYNNNFSKLCPIFTPNMRFNSSDVKKNSARPEDDSSSCANKSDTDSCSEGGGENYGASDGEVSLDEMLLDGKAKKKIEQLAALVGVDTTDPAVVLAEVVRVLKVFKRINMY